MSFDIHIVRPACDHCSRKESWEWDWSGLTYNLSPMFTKAMGGKGLRGLDGLKCSEAVEVVRVGLANMRQNRTEYEALNPPNGWGNFTGAREFMGFFLTALEKHPNDKVEIR